MSTPNNEIPALKSLPLQSVEAINRATKIGDVVNLFNKNPLCIAIPVVEDGHFLGLVNRKKLFFTFLNHPFGLELYSKKPISTFLSEVGLTMNANQDILNAFALMVAYDPDLEADSFAIIENGFYRGVIKVSDLMMAISSIQAGMLKTLETLSRRLREEVAKGREIQHDLLPLTEITFKNLSVAGKLITSTEIGGDFFDYFSLTEDRVAIVIGDVSGHGVQSGMITTAAKASLHTLVSMGIFEPAQMLSYMNKAILQTTNQSLLMTCFIAIADLAGQSLSYSNAGHPFPFLMNGDTTNVTMLDAVSGFPLGLDPDFSFSEATLPFAGGDKLLLYTDGIVECTDRNGEDFGFERLQQAFSSRAELLPAQLCQSLIQIAKAFREAPDFEDDVAIVVVSMIR